MAYINGREVLFSPTINATIKTEVLALKGLIEGTIVDCEIPEGVTKISRSCFAGCDNLASLTIAESVKSIGIACASGCLKLKNVTFKGKPDSIQQVAFNNSSIERIECPWKEGEVANAPWGAQNATIVYTG